MQHYGKDNRQRGEGEGRGSALNPLAFDTSGYLIYTYNGYLFTEAAGQSAGYYGVSN